MDGSRVNLIDFRGKVVLIDTWATWCGPCIAERPRVLEIARKFKGNSNVAILMISVDTQLPKWKAYVTKTNINNDGTELIIEDGMNTAFGDKYFIKAIPKYILIDPDGIIIDSSLAVFNEDIELLIEKNLFKN